MDLSIDSPHSLKKFDADDKPVLGIRSNGTIFYYNISAKEIMGIKTTKSQKCKTTHYFQNFNLEDLQPDRIAASPNVKLTLRKTLQDYLFGVFIIPSPEKDFQYLFVGETSAQPEKVFQKLESVRIAQAEDRYRGLVELSPDGMLVLVDNLIVYSNISGVNIFGGMSVIDLIHLDIFDFIKPEYTKKIRREFKKILTRNQVGDKLEIAINRLDGEEIYVDALGVPINYEEHKAVQFIVRDISERKLSESILKESERQFRDMFYNHTAPRLIIDALDNGKIFDANKAAAKLYGYPIENLKTMTIDLINTLPSKIVHQEMEKAIHGKKFFFEFQHKNAAGELIYVEVHSTPITIKNKLMLYSVIHDVTGRKIVEAERERLIDELEAANRKLKDMSKMKEEFLAIASHDLRSPFTAILGFSQILMYDKSLDEKKRDYAERIYNSASTQLSYVNDLLHSIRLETGEITLHISPVHLDKLILQCVNTFIILAEKKEIRLTTKLDFHESVYVDEEKIIQVLNNLLSNAIKFTPQNGNITIESISSQSGEFSISIKDTGMGISQKVLKLLFKKYHKITTRGTEGEMGTGLGLTISKNLVELHGGTIQVKSKPGKGSNFIITLPIKNDRLYNKK